MLLYQKYEILTNNMFIHLNRPKLPKIQLLHSPYYGSRVIILNKIWYTLGASQSEIAENKFSTNFISDLYSKKGNLITLRHFLLHLDEWNIVNFNGDILLQLSIRKVLFPFTLDSHAFRGKKIHLRILRKGSPVIHVMYYILFPILYSLQKNHIWQISSFVHSLCGLYPQSKRM